MLLSIPVQSSGLSRISLGRNNPIFCQIFEKPSEIEKIQHIVFVQRVSIFLFKEKIITTSSLNVYNIFQLQEVDISGNKLQDLAGLKGLSNLTVSSLLPCRNTCQH